MYMIQHVQDPADVMTLSGPDARQPRVSPDEWVQPGALGLAAVGDSGAPLGAVLLVPHRRVAATVISFRVAWLYVDQASRRRGIATALLREAAREALAAGVTRVHVDVHPDNHAGVALFDSLGPADGAAYVVCLKHGAF